MSLRRDCMCHGDKVFIECEWDYVAPDRYARVSFDEFSHAIVLTLRGTRDKLRDLTFSAGVKIRGSLEVLAVATTPKEGEGERSSSHCASTLPNPSISAMIRGC